MSSASVKEADLAGPGIGDYDELERILPDDYRCEALIEDGLCRRLGLTLVQVPLIVDVASGVDDYLDRDGSRTPVRFHIANDRDTDPIDAETRGPPGLPRKQHETQ